MKNLIPLLTLAALLALPSRIIAEAKLGLETGFTYREVQVVLDEIPVPMKKLKMNEDSIGFAVRQKLMSRGLKPVPVSPTGCALRITFTFGVAPRGNYASCYVHCALVKNPLYYGLPIDRGLDSTVYTHGYGKLVGSHPGIIGETVLKGLKDILSTFITDYMESNAAYEATFADKRLRGIDRAIKGNSFRLRQSDQNFEGIDLWRKRYEEVLKAR